MNHLLVLGILLGAVLLLAAFGIFRPRVRHEGFQAATWVTRTPREVSGISMDGYTYSDLRIMGGIFSAPPGNESTEIHSVQLNEGGNEFVIATKGRMLDNKINEINMVLITLDIDSDKKLLVKISDAGTVGTANLTGGSPSSLTDAVIREAWTQKTNIPIADTDGVRGSGIKNLIIRLVRKASGTTTDAAQASQAAQATQRTIMASQSIMKCPAHYTFFNSSNGDSLCCRGTVNPYKNTCENTKALRDICSLSGSVKDPRDTSRNLQMCRDIIANETAQASASCPTSLPHLAAAVVNGMDDYKCCANPATMDGTNFKCSTEDLKDTSRYCIVDGKGDPVKNTTDGKMERMCSEGVMLDTAACPRDDLGRQVFQNVNYVMGDREAIRYDMGDLKGLTIPTCFRLNETCIPESAIEYAQKRGAYKEYDPKTWEFSCAVWSRKNRGEIVADSVKGYLSNPLGGASDPNAARSS